jgi:hypothetical protein
MLVSKKTNKPGLWCYPVLKALGSEKINCFKEERGNRKHV